MNKEIAIAQEFLRVKDSIGECVLYLDEENYICLHRLSDTGRYSKFCFRMGSESDIADLYRIVSAIQDNDENCRKYALVDTESESEDDVIVVRDFGKVGEPDNHGFSFHICITQVCGDIAWDVRQWDESGRCRQFSFRFDDDNFTSVIVAMTAMSLDKAAIEGYEISGVDVEAEREVFVSAYSSMIANE